VVLAEIESIVKTLPAQPAKPVPKKAVFICPHCGKQFPAAMKFCGECGKEMTA
jgi:predicted amidophosphoribosyltransferase